MFDGRIWHGTGRNLTGEPRYAVLSYHCRPWVRQQENVHLALAPEVLAACSDHVRARIGYKMWAGLGKTTQGQMAGDELVERVARPVTALAADGSAL